MKAEITGGPRDIAEALEEICGPDAVIYGNPKKLEKYSHDAVAEKQYAHFRQVVVAPSTTDQVAAVLRLANEKRVPATPRAAGSGLSGGSIPIYGGIVLSGERMN